MVTTKTETTHGLTYLMARVIDITAWQSADAICLCCLTHGACVKVTGLQPLLTTVQRRLLLVAHVKEESYRECFLDKYPVMTINEAIGLHLGKMES